MLKPIALVTSAALLFSSCQSKSPTWQKVMATPRATGDAENRDRAYAAELHRQLGVSPHKVVTYEFDNFSKLRGSETVRRTAVFYHDPANQKQPWWAMDPELEKPVWIPNEPLPRQVSFYSRRQSRIVEVQDYTVSRDKVARPAERHTRPVGITSLQRAEPVTVSRVEEPRESKRKWRLFGPREAVKKPAISRIEPAPKPVVVKTISKPVATKSAKKTQTKAAAKPKAEVETKKPAEKPDTAKTEAAKVEAAKSEPATAEGPKTETTKPVAKPEPAKPDAKPSTTPSGPTATDTKPAPATEPKKRPLLFNREKDEPAPAKPSEKKDAAIEPRRPNLFQRILSSLNPARWFRKTA